MEVKFPESDRKELQFAKNLLENPGVAAKITNFIGAPIEKGLGLLPDNWKTSIGDVTKTALMKASDAAIFTMKDLPGESSSNRWHKLCAAVSGGIGGFFGISAIAVELPISTTIMLRSIADIARSEGESRTPQTGIDRSVCGKWLCFNKLIQRKQKKRRLFWC